MSERLINNSSLYSYILHKYENYLTVVSYLTLNQLSLDVRDYIFAQLKDHYLFSKSISKKYVYQILIKSFFIPISPIRQYIEINNDNKNNLDCMKYVDVIIEKFIEDYKIYIGREDININIVD